MITITDVLTNKQWILPNAIGASPVYLGNYQLPPGRYDIQNGSGAMIIVVGTSGVVARIPSGVTWNVATQENDRSVLPYCLDFAVWQHSGRFN